MSQTEKPSRTRAIIITAVVVVVVAIIAFFVIRQVSSGTQDATASSSPNSTVVPTPEASDFEAPSPRPTEDVVKPDAEAPVPFDESVTTASDLKVTVDKVEGVTAGSNVPGEIAGPALKVTVTVHNAGATAVDTAGANLTLTYGGDAATPAPPVSDESAVLWPTSLAPNSSATGVFLFSVPAGSEGDVRVIVDLLASEPDVVFAGPSPQ